MLEVDKALLVTAHPRRSNLIADTSPPGFTEGRKDREGLAARDMSMVIILSAFYISLRSLRPSVKSGLLKSPACVPENSNQTRQPTPVERFLSILTPPARRRCAGRSAA